MQAKNCLPDEGLSVDQVKCVVGDVQLRRPHPGGQVLVHHTAQCFTYSCSKQQHKCGIHHQQPVDFLPQTALPTVALTLCASKLLDMSYSVHPCMAKQQEIQKFTHASTTKKYQILTSETDQKWKKKRKVLRTTWIWVRWYNRVLRWTVSKKRTWTKGDICIQKTPNAALVTPVYYLYVAFLAVFSLKLVTIDTRIPSSIPTALCHNRRYPLKNKQMKMVNGNSPH